MVDCFVSLVAAGLVRARPHQESAQPLGGRSVAPLAAGGGGPAGARAAHDGGQPAAEAVVDGPRPAAHRLQRAARLPLRLPALRRRARLQPTHGGQQAQGIKRMTTTWHVG